MNGVGWYVEPASGGMLFTTIGRPAFVEFPPCSCTRLITNDKRIRLLTTPMMAAMARTVAVDVAPRRPRQAAGGDERLGQRPSGAHHQEQAGRQREELGRRRLLLGRSHLLGELAADAPGAADRVGVEVARHQADESDAEQQERHEEQEQPERDRVAEHRARRHAVPFVHQETGVDDGVALPHLGRPRRRRLRPFGTPPTGNVRAARGDVDHLRRLVTRYVRSRQSPRLTSCRSAGLDVVHEPADVVLVGDERRQLQAAGSIAPRRCTDRRTIRVTTTA